MEDVSTLPQRKMSRYRSQRTSRITTAEHAPPMPQLPLDQHATSDIDPTARSRSRYHAKTSSTRPPLRDDGDGSPSSPTDPSARGVDSRGNEQSASPQSPHSGRFHQSPVELAGLTQDNLRQLPPESRRYAAHRVDSGTTLPSTASHQSMNDRSEVRILPFHTLSNSPPPNGELFPPLRPTTPLRIDGPPRSDQIRAPPPVTGELFPPIRSPSPKHFDGPPRSDQIRAHRSTLSLQTSPKEEQVGVLNKLRKKHARQSSADKQLISREQPQTRQEEIVVGADAPISAVNAGERRVMVECGRTRMLYPVTPTTTSVDLIKSASNTMSESINTRSAVMLEYFTTVGVHRTLRHYEHVRDVMNSWDDDKQNTLLIVDSGLGAARDELNLSGAPKQKPRADKKWSLHYSHTVGKWDKRGIILKPDGQILMLKDPRRPDDVTNVCRLSDFDIYTPTPEKAKKKIKPPKKYCFAIKSQQKSSMFESTTNFVHFFCTADQGDADSFHAAVQSWRSWYLVNIMGEGSKATKEQTVAQNKPNAALSPATRTHKRTDTVESHYQLGTFAPLLDLNQFGSDSDRAIDPRVNHNLEPARSQHSITKAGPQPVAVPPLQAEDEPLAYLRRRQSVLGVRQTASPTTSSFGKDVKSSQLAVDGAPRRRESTRTQPRKPLLDVSQGTEPSRQLTKGRGHRPAHLGTGRLIEAARSPEDIVPPPHARDYNVDRELAARRPTSIDRNTAAQHAAQYRPGTESQQAFTGAGLLAGAKASWGSGNRGRGIIDGSRATGPMVDLSLSSQFEQGSLLQQVARQQGPPQPTIDRQKYIEKMARTGEGF